jgi:hypothetical protein
MLSTTGAISNVSVMGQTSCTSIGNSVSTFRKWSSSKAISTVAEPTGKWEKFLLVIESIGAVIGLADAAVSEAENVMTGVQKGADSAAKVAQALINQSEDACNKAKSDAAAILATLKSQMNATQLAALTDYEAKVAAAQACWTDADTGITALKDARDLARTKCQTETETLKTAAITAKTTEYTAAKTAAATSQTALEAILTTLNTPEAKKYQAMVTACKAYRDARDTNDEVIRNANYTKWWVTDGYLGSGVTEARTVMSTIKAVAGWLNLLLSLIGFIKELLQKSHEEAHFGRAGKTFNAVAPQLSTTAKVYGFGITAPTGAGAAALAKFKPASIRHTVGSDGTMTMYGKERVLVHSPLLVLSGAPSYPEDDAAATAAMTADLTDAGINLGPATSATKHKDGSVIVVAEKNALVLGKVGVEVNGLTKATVASQAEVLLSAKKQPAMSPGGMRMPAMADTPESKLVAKQDGTLLLDATDSITARAIKTLTLKVCKGTTPPSCTLEAKDTGCVTLTTTDSITMTGDKKLSLAAKTAATLELDAAAKKLAAKAGSTELTMADPAGLDAKAGDAKLKLSSTVAALVYSRNGIEATPDGVSIGGPKIVVAGTAEVEISAKGRVLLG